MKTTLGLCAITKNNAALLPQMLSSVQGLVNEIVIIDDGSTDNTVEIAKQYGARVFIKSGYDLGSKRAYALAQTKSEWILMLDADETISLKLKSQIENLQLESQKYSGFYIPYQNHLFGKPIYYGGENYKILRLFKKREALITSNLVHEHVRVSGKIGLLTAKIHHYSYQNPIQMFVKFTDYAKREAIQKARKGESSSLKKIVMYPVHMFYERYISDKGYKDYPLRILLDMGFAYMEFMTYVFLILYRIIYQKSQNV